MLLSLLLLSIPILFFAYRGFRKGFFGALSGILSLIAGYTASILGLKPVAHLIKAITSLDGMLLYLVAGLLAFTAASLLVSVIFNQLDRWVSTKDKLSGASKVGGILVGTLVGGVIGIFAVYALSVYRDIKAPENSTKISALDNTSRRILSSATATTLSQVYPEASTFSETLVQNPVRVSKSLNKVLNNNDLRALFGQPRYQAMLSQGEVDALTKTETFKRLSRDPDLQYLLIHSDIAQPGETPETALAKKMSEAVQRVQATKNDAQVQAIIEDPAFQKKLQADDKMALMRDPQLLELAELIFASKN